MYFNFFGLIFPSTFYSLNLCFLFELVNSFLLGVILFVFFSISSLFFCSFYFKVSGLFYSFTEFVLMLFPIFILLFQLSYGLFVLYSMSALDTSSSLTFNVTGHQWYWSYGFSDFPDLSFDSFMKSDLSFSDSRLLSVDCRLVVPVDLSLRFCVTSADVIHSWSLPAAGIKLDAIPGVLNVLTSCFSFVGVYYGQCSEICGANHSFMPIVLEVTSWDLFLGWLSLLL